MKVVNSAFKKNMMMKNIKTKVVFSSFLLAILTSNIAMAVVTSEQAEELFNLAEQAFPELFNPPLATQTFPPNWQHYRGPYGNNIYVGVDVEDLIYVLGGTFGIDPTNVGTYQDVLTRLQNNTAKSCSNEFSVCEYYDLLNAENPTFDNIQACMLHTSKLEGKPCNSEFKVTKLEYNNSLSTSTIVTGDLLVYWEATPEFWNIRRHQEVSIGSGFNSKTSCSENCNGAVGAVLYSINEGDSNPYIAKDYFVCGDFPLEEDDMSIFQNEFIAFDRDSRILDRRNINFTCRINR